MTILPNRAQLIVIILGMLMASGIYLFFEAYGYSYTDFGIMTHRIVKVPGVGAFLGPIFLSVVFWFSLGGTILFRTRNRDSSVSVRSYLSAAVLAFVAVSILIAVLGAYTWSNSTHIVSTLEWQSLWIHQLVSLSVSISAMTVFELFLSKDSNRHKITLYIVLLFFIVTALLYAGVVSGRVYSRLFG